ncbi:MAG TPA: hypothetical protein VNS22_18810 [Geminicoccus sp.]|uniref:hypothetical protein n=1 Tax=Geminicoccus sp. TaxID=2024832 RepID=UPI002BE193F8|nr:hypothetical protein [Geminicoccus sp.]HWL70411.1 hypothetical protein [Geminicoccus sp.]
MKPLLGRALYHIGHRLTVLGLQLQLGMARFDAEIMLITLHSSMADEIRKAAEMERG